MAELSKKQSEMYDEFYKLALYYVEDPFDKNKPISKGKHMLQVVLDAVGSIVEYGLNTINQWKKYQALLGKRSGRSGALVNQTNKLKAMQGSKGIIASIANEADQAMTAPAPSKGGKGGKGAGKGANSSPVSTRAVKGGGKGGGKGIGKGGKAFETIVEEPSILEEEAPRSLKGVGKGKGPNPAPTAEGGGKGAKGAGKGGRGAGIPASEPSLTGGKGAKGAKGAAPIVSPVEFLETYPLEEVLPTGEALVHLRKVSQSLRALTRGTNPNPNPYPRSNPGSKPRL